MSKKMMLLALAVTAMFALPSAASAQEAHVSGINNFSGHGLAGTFSATGEPTIKCSTTLASGSFDVGSTTTGIISLDFILCTAEFLGIKGECHTANSVGGTIATSGAFHVVTINNKPGMLVTPVTTTIICAGFSRVELSGNIIGTITSPACGAKSKTLAVAFNASGSTQEHIFYTGVPYDLKAQTENSSGVTTGSAATASLTSTPTLTSGMEGTLECT